MGIAVQHFPRYVNKTYAPHGLAMVLLTYIVSGSGRHIMGDHVFQETGGSIAVTHYRQEHEIITDDTGMEIYNIYLDLSRHGLPQLPSEFHGVLPEILPLDPAFHNQVNRRVRIKFDNPDPVTALVVRMYNELLFPEAGAEEVVRSMFRVLLIECCRQARKSSLEPLSQTAGPPIPWLEELRRKLDSEHRSQVSVEDLASDFGRTTSHLCRAFKKYTGKTVMDYVMERRVQSAMLQLRGTTDKIAGVALDSGFNDLSHFNRTFKRMLGCSPREYRQAGLGEQT
jgi:AraC-like DNA-binding protein